MTQRNAILEELHTFRVDMQKNNVLYHPHLRLNVWRPICDITVDWVTILLAVAVVQLVGWGVAPLSIIVIANRQRALGNILHDAGHRNLHRSLAINDPLANLLIAPLLFVCLRTYRTNHLQHHLHLGHPEDDPDYLRPPPEGETKWVKNFARNVFSFRSWWGGFAGHLGTGGLPVRSYLRIAAWWSLVGSLMYAVLGVKFTCTFALLWLTAKATIFHVITVFREMCDHYGMKPNGVISFTRDIVQHNMWSFLVHPRNNGYHLTHHLLPAVPYYRLPNVHQLASTMQMYRDAGHSFTSYAKGSNPVAKDWVSKGDVE